MSLVFQNIDPPPPGECVPPAFGAGGGHTRWVEKGVGGQYFGRRQTQLCTLHVSTLCTRMHHRYSRYSFIQVMISDFSKCQYNGQNEYLY
jgi:hypothetical protein